MCFIAPLAQAVAKFCAHKHEATFYQQLNMSRQGPTAPSSNSRNCCGVDGFEEAAITGEAGATPNNVQLGLAFDQVVEWESECHQGRRGRSVASQAGGKRECQQTFLSRRHLTYLAWLNATRWASSPSGWPPGASTGAS